MNNLRSLLLPVSLAIGFATTGCGDAGTTATATFTPPTTDASAATNLLPIEKSRLTFGFIKLTDCAPLVIAREKGFFSDEGLDVALEPQANWKVLLDRVITGDLDGAHMLAGQPIAATIGFGTNADVVTSCSLGYNGNAITVSNAIWNKMKPLVDMGSDGKPLHPITADALSALDNVLIGVNQVFAHLNKAERQDIARHYLGLLGMNRSLGQKPANLSQGMRQRVGLARAFALSPKMLLLDEPFGMLDKLTKYDLQGVLLDLWNRVKITALMVTHDVDEAIYLSDRVVLMSNGPEAAVGEILEISFPRPRRRKEIMQNSLYQRYREHLLSFLKQRAHLHESPRTCSAETDTLLGFNKPQPCP